jgi:hypothetical protein
MKKRLILIFALLMLGLCCGESEIKDSSQMNSFFTKAKDGFEPSSSQIRIFTASNLTEYFQRNKVEMEKLLLNQRIMVSGVVSRLEDEYIQLEGVNQGKVRCSGALFYQDEWKKLNGFIVKFNKTRSTRPLATVSGIYKSSVLPNVFLEECKIETATK